MGKQGGYEAHITCDKQYAREVEQVAEATGWVFSVISGCPILGQGTYCYLTNYNKDNPALLLASMQGVSRGLQDRGVSVLRSKIEHIVYDSKTGVNEL